MNLVLTFNNFVVLNTPVSSELEFFKLLAYLEQRIQGTAMCSLFSNAHIVIQRPLNKTPRSIVNGNDGKTYSFEHFKRHSADFPLRDNLLYANYSNDPQIKYKYGFL